VRAPNRTLADDEEERQSLAPLGAIDVALVMHVYSLESGAGRGDGIVQVYSGSSRKVHA